ncbi:hypothetical protein V2G26_007582 [Clonostachys chloroleuca]
MTAETLKLSLNHPSLQYKLNLLLIFLRHSETLKLCSSFFAWLYKVNLLPIFFGFPVEGHHRSRKSKSSTSTQVGTISRDVESKICPQMGDGASSTQGSLSYLLAFMNDDK